MIKPRFTPEVNLGHLFQAAIVVLMMAPGYISLVRDQARLDAEQKAIVAAQVAANAAESLRITNDEHRMDVSDANFTAFQAEMRDQINKVLDRLGEVTGLLDSKHR